MADILIKEEWKKLVFAGRNQAYGAYELRQLNNRYTTTALFIGVAIFAISISLPVILSYININSEDKIENVEVNLEMLAPPPIDPNTPPPPPPPKIEMPKLAAAVKFLPPKVEEDEKVQDEEPPTVDEMKDKQISTENREGAKTEVDVIEEAAPVVEKEEEIFLVVEESPEPEGGMIAMQKFIAKNISYPRQASQMGLEGRVIVSFVVNSSGMIENPEVLKGIGGGCDEEAIRVIKLLPKWKPGKQNGRAVKVKFTVPIKFTLN